jgi:hypothetical protein
MKSFLFIFLLSFFITVCCACTTNTATVRINNQSGKKILSATLTHRYSTAFVSQQIFTNIFDGQTSVDYLTVQYNTGFLCTGSDWWHITWVAEDGTTYASNPNNGQCWLNYLGTVALKITSSYAPGIQAGLTRLAVKLSTTTAKVVSQGNANGDPSAFCGFKGCTLESQDANSNFNINLYSSTNEGFQIAPSSGACTTDYQVLNICPGFAQIANWDLSGNDIGDTSNPPKAPTKEVCCTQCYLHSQCQAYTWNSVNQNCYFKAYSSGTGVASSNAQSGIRQGK